MGSLGRKADILKNAAKGSNLRSMLSYIFYLLF